jgi:hypothetical protein
MPQDATKPRTHVIEDEKAASDKLAREAVIRARNKKLREPSHAHGPDRTPPFTNHSGEL